MHYPDRVLGGTLAQALIVLGDQEVRRTQQFVIIHNSTFNTSCQLTLLDRIPQRRVAKLCKKRRIAVEQLTRQLKTVQST